MPDGSEKSIPLSGGRVLSFRDRPLVMGILNCTSDSFYDGGSYADPAAACRHAFEMIDEGAGIIDVGGESTRPGSNSVALDDELAHVIPVIEKIRESSDIPISIDTCKAEVARQAVDAGADIVNDVSAMASDKNMPAVVCELDVPVVLMHMQGTPENMQENPHYECVSGEVADYLLERAKVAQGAGIKKEKIIFDPGFGFGKTFAHNARLLGELESLVAVGYPVLVGMSRKSMIGHALGLEVGERLEASLALAVMAAERGAAIIRVHDVEATVRAVGMSSAVLASCAQRGGVA